MADDFDDTTEGMFQETPGLEPTPASLAHWVQEQYVGDDRFETIEVLEPGHLEGEDVRTRFICSSQSHFFISVFSDDGMVRVGLATESPEVVEAIEQAVDENGGSLSEFMEDTLDMDEEIEHEVKHFHDDVDYFCSEIPYQREDDLGSEVVRDEVIYYLDAFINSLLDFAKG